MKTKKIFFIIIMILLMFSIKLNATDSIIQGADDFLDAGDENILNKAQIKITSDTIFNMFFAIGTIIIIIIGAVLGIRFIMSSTEEKAEIKESIKPFVTGAIVIYGAVAIWMMAVQVLQSIF